MSLCLIAVLLIAATVALPAQPRQGAKPDAKEQRTVTALKLKLTKGMTFRQRVYRDQTTSQMVPDKKKGGDKKLVQRRETTIDYHFLVESVDAKGNAIVFMRYDSVIADYLNDTARSSYNSTDTSTWRSANAFPFHQIMGKGIRLEVGADGGVRRLMGLDSLRNQLAKLIDRSDSVRGANQDQVLIRTLSEESMMETIFQSLPFLPVKSVKVGDTWTRNYLSDVGVPLTLNTTYTLVRMENDGRMVLEEKSIVGNNHKARKFDQPGVRLHYEISGTQSGTIEVNRATGWNMSSMIRREFTGRMQVFDEANSRIIYESPLTDVTTIRTRSWAQ